VSCADAGGNIPSSMQNLAGPKQTKATVENLIALIHKKSLEKAMQTYVSTLSPDDHPKVVADLRKVFDSKVDQLIKSAKATEE